MIKPYSELTDEKKAAAKLWLLGAIASFVFPLVSLVGLLLYMLLSEHASTLFFFVGAGIAYAVKRIGLRFCIRRLEHIAEIPAS